MLHLVFVVKAVHLCPHGGVGEAVSPPLEDGRAVLGAITGAVPPP